MKAARIAAALACLVLSSQSQARPVELIFDIFPESFYDYTSGMGTYPQGTSYEYSMIIDDFGMPKTPSAFTLSASPASVDPMPQMIREQAELDLGPLPREYEMGGSVQGAYKPATEVTQGTSSMPFTTIFHVLEVIRSPALPENRVYKAVTLTIARDTYQPEANDRGRLDLFLAPYVANPNDDPRSWAFSADVTRYEYSPGCFPWNCVRQGVPDAQFDGYARLKSARVLPPVTPVPEPQTLAFLVGGFLTVAAVTRRRNRG